MTKHTTPFLMVDYDLLGFNSVEVNGETHEVKLHHKIVYSYLLSLSGTFKQVTPSLTGIGKRLGLGTDQTVRRHIKDLVSFGWVQVVSEGRKGMTNIYIVLPYHQKPPVTVSDEVPAPEPVKAAEEQSIPDWDDIPCAWDDFDYQSAPTMPIQQDRPEFPWGGVAICKPNGQPPDAAVKWALTETMGDENAAYQLISRVVSERTGRTEVFTPQTEEDFDSIPF